MCQRQDAVLAVTDAATALTRACHQLCTDELGRALRAHYDSVISEGVKPQERELLRRLP